MQSSELDLIATEDVAQLLHVSTTRVRALDSVLNPLRLGARGFRVYRRENVMRYLGHRDAQRAARAAKH